MGKKGKKAQAGKPKKLTPKDIGKRLDALVKKLEEELEGADLFVPPPPMDDCPICLVRLSRMSGNSTYQDCCGKRICNACFRENVAFIGKQNERNAGKKDKKQMAHTCPLCREPLPSSLEKMLHQRELRASRGDPFSCSAMGKDYLDGKYGRRNELKALDCWIRAAELGSAEACTSLAICLQRGIGVSVDKNIPALFHKIGTIRGSVQSRHNIGCEEYYDFGNHEIGVRHLKIAAEAGSQPSLNRLRDIYNADGKEPGKEFISKEDMDQIYRDCHEAQEMIKSEEREKHHDTEDEMKC